MPETDYTTNRHIPYPTGKDLISEGPANMEAIANAVDEENRGEIDYLEAGVTQSSDWSFTAAMESPSECKLASEAEVAESVCWLPLTAIGLVRSVTPKAKIKALKPSSLPGPGKYMTVGIELTPSTSDAAATVSVVAGVEQATQKAAEEHVPATTAGKLRIRNIVILNTAGTYSIAAQTDVRPWCTGGTVAETKEEGKVGTGAISTRTIAPEAVTDAKIATGRALVETGNAYSALTGRASGTEYEPSATRFTFVTIQMHNTSNGTAGIESAVYVGGVEIARPGYYPVTADSGLSGNVAYSFLVPPGKKWKAEVVATGGGAAELKSSYLTL